MAMKKDPAPVEIAWQHTPMAKGGKPFFPENPVVASPFWLHQVRGWQWETKVVTPTLQYLREGHIRYEIDGCEFEVFKGGSFFFRPGQSVKGRDVGGIPVTMLGTHFTRYPLEDLPRGIANTTIRQTELFESLADHAVAWRQMRGAIPKRQCEAAIRMLYAIFIGNLEVPVVDPDERKIHDLLESIRMKPAAHWPVERMCEETRIGRTRLTRLFHELTGVTPNRFVIQVRVAKATQLLRMTDMPVAEIANELGYSDVYFFHRQFSKFAGSSPSRYRRQGSSRSGG